MDFCIFLLLKKIEMQVLAFRGGGGGGGGGGRERLDLVLMHNVSFQFKNMVYPQILACTPKMGTQRGIAK